MKRFFSCAFVLTVALLSGCGAYHKYNDYTGYSDSPLKKDVYVVSFIGDQRAAPTQVHAWAMLRGAELTVEKGMRFFETMHSETERKRVRSYTPEQLEDRVTTTKDANGNEVTEHSYITMPSHVNIEYYTVVKLTIKVLGAPTQESLDALALLREGKQQGIKFSPAVESVLTPRKPR